MFSLHFLRKLKSSVIPLLFPLFLLCLLISHNTMSSSVCQGQQSCLEPCVLMHKLAPPPKSHNNCAGDCDHKSNNNDEPGDWSCIQALTNTSHISKESVYVHSLVKYSSSTLSMKSLEMCTESLGSETGSDISECSNEFSSLLSENQNFHTMRRSKPREFTKKVIGNDSFPPPLSWIRGSDTVQVRPHREDGRLVIKAVSVSPPNTYLQAERVNGRLRLGLLKECSPSCCESKVSKDKEEEANKYYENVEEDEDEGDQEQYVNDDEDSGGDCCWSEGNGELPRPTRCKEGGSGSGSGNKEMSSWGPFYVAIS